MTSLVNTSKPTTFLANPSRPSSGELWSSISTTWASETRTWAGMISFFTNGSKPTTSLDNTAKPS